MAKKKKSYKPHVPASNSPNKALVVFLVFFILLSCGLGYLTYEGYNAQDKAEAKAKESQEKLNVANKTKSMYHYFTLEARAAMDPQYLEKEKTDEEILLKSGREKLRDGEFKGDPLEFRLRKMTKENADLLGWDPEKKTYATTYKEKVKELQKQLKETEATYEAELAKYKNLNQQFAFLDQKHKEFVEGVRTEIQNFHSKIQKASQEKTTEYKEIFDKKVELTNKINKLLEKHDQDLRGKDRQIHEWVKKYQKAVKDAELAMAKQGEGVSEEESIHQPHALFLDISTGKPLWDRPRGKIQAVDRDSRQVIINIGSNHEVKSGLTFNVFAPSPGGGAQGPLRGTIEVLNVIDGNTSLAHITSLYSSDGTPIPLYDINKGAVLRAGDNPMQEGDLLFNTIWKSHVALTGLFRFFDYDVSSPTEDMRQIKQLIVLLRQQGITVDAYLDLVNAEVVGEISPKTQFLILGQTATSPEGKVGVKQNTANYKLINEKMEEMFNNAVSKGMFVISAHNFATVMGYRPPRSATETWVSEFQPAAPMGFNPLLNKQEMEEKK